MLALDVRIDEAVQIGDDPDTGAVLRIQDRSGARVQILFYTNLRVQRIASGIIPQTFVTGITGRKTPVERHHARVS